MIKYRLYGTDKAAKESAEQTLYSTFSKITQLFAPFMPHITEELYQELFKDNEMSIHLTQIPQFEPIDTEALELGSIAAEIIGEIRKYKTTQNLSLGAELPKLTVQHPSEKAELVLNEIASTCRIKDLHIEKGELAVK
jgi:valyl-tRNA synthetase